MNHQLYPPSPPLPTTTPTDTYTPNWMETITHCSQPRTLNYQFFRFWFPVLVSEGSWMLQSSEPGSSLSGDRRRNRIWNMFSWQDRSSTRPWEIFVRTKSFAWEIGIRSSWMEERTMDDTRRESRTGRRTRPWRSKRTESSVWFVTKFSRMFTCKLKSLESNLIYLIIFHRTFFILGLFLSFLFV